MSFIPTGVDLLGFDTSVNQLLRIRKADKNYFTPQHEFSHAWLTKHCSYTSAQVDVCIESVKAKQWATSSMRGAGKPCSAAHAKIGFTPLPHCSINPSSRNTLAITGLRIMDMPRFISSIVIPGKSIPGLSISIRSS